MTKEELINKPVIDKNGETLSIQDIEESNNVKEIVIRLNNKKMYNLYLCFKSGFLRFKDEELNNKMNAFIDNENKEIKRMKMIEEESKKKRIEEEEKERTKLENAIKEFRGEYSFLSNFHKCNVTYKGITYSNNEAAFQAQKDVSRSKEFQNLSPVLAKRLGRRVNLRPDWETVKLGIMEEILRCKFDQNHDLKEKLIETDDRLLIEGNTWGDTFWGVSKGKGNNNLGILLMKIREEYKKQ